MVPSMGIRTTGNKKTLFRVSLFSSGEWTWSSQWVFEPLKKRHSFECLYLVAGVDIIPRWDSTRNKKTLFRVSL